LYKAFEDIIYDMPFAAYM